MKKLLVVSAMIVGFSMSAQATMSYECWAYKNGSPDKMTKVSADNKAEAEKKAEKKFRDDLDVSFDYVQCK